LPIHSNIQIMKKIIKLLLFLTPSWGAGGLFAQNTDTTDTGVVINGVTWATRNVDAPGTFAKTPESAGMFYQWNRKKGWSATEPAAWIKVDNWDTTTSTGIMWEKANDPSPVGWRVPTEEEQRTLLDTAKVTNKWTTQNNVNGRKFTDKATGNSLFFPAVGSRIHDTGELSDTDEFGFYWGATIDENYRNLAFHLFVCEGYVGVYGCNGNEGFSIRPVLAK